MNDVGRSRLVIPSGRDFEATISAGSAWPEAKDPPTTEMCCEHFVEVVNPESESISQLRNGPKNFKNLD